MQRLTWTVSVPLPPGGSKPRRVASGRGIGTGVFQVNAVLSPETRRGSLLSLPREDEVRAPFSCSRPVSRNSDARPQPTPLSRVSLEPRPVMRRDGYTLLEVLIVVGILLLLAAFSIPALQTAFGFNSVRNGAQAVREAIGDARFQAIQSGLVYEFRFEPTGRCFA